MTPQPDEIDDYLAKIRKSLGPPPTLLSTSLTPTNVKRVMLKPLNLKARREEDQGERDSREYIAKVNKIL